MSLNKFSPLTDGNLGFLGQNQEQGKAMSQGSPRNHCTVSGFTNWQPGGNLFY